MPLWSGFPAFFQKSWGIFAFYFNKIPNKTDETCTQILFFTILFTKKSQNHNSHIGNRYLTEKHPLIFGPILKIPTLVHAGERVKWGGVTKTDLLFCSLYRGGSVPIPPTITRRHVWFSFFQRLCWAAAAAAAAAVCGGVRHWAVWTLV